MNQNIKNEVPFFIKSTLLVIFISGILSVVTLTLMQTDATKINMMQVTPILGSYIYLIKIFSIIITSAFLLPQEDRKNFRKFLANSIKIAVYYTFVSLILLGFQYFYYAMT